MSKKIVAVFLLSNFLLFACKPMEPLKTNLGKLKDSLGELKTKLGNLQSKLEGLEEILVDQPYGDRAFAAKKIIIDGKEYCTCEFWNLPKLRNYVKKNKQPFSKTNRAFNVIDRTQNCDEYSDFTEKATDLAMKDPKYRGAVFQLAANDSVAGTWISGGSHAGYVVERTNLGQIIRNVKRYDYTDLNNFFYEPSLNETYQHQNATADSWYKNGVCLNSLRERAENLNGIIIAINSGANLFVADEKTGDELKSMPINVVLTAAYSRPKPGTDDQRAKNCLKAGYDGILLSAIKLGVSKVVLTIIGGHVFLGNPDFTFAAIEQAVKKYAVKYNLNVTLYLDDAQFNGGATQKLMDERFKTLRREINGGDYNIEP